MRPAWKQSKTCGREVCDWVLIPYSRLIYKPGSPRRLEQKIVLFQVRDPPRSEEKWKSSQHQGKPPRTLPLHPKCQPPSNVGLQSPELYRPMRRKATLRALSPESTKNPHVRAAQAFRDPNQSFILWMRNWRLRERP